MSLSLGGSDDYGRVLTTPITGYGSGLTIVGWGKFSAGGSTIDALATIGTTGSIQNALSCRSNSNGTVSARAYDATTNSGTDSLVGITKTTDLDWHHYCVIFESDSVRRGVLDGDWANSTNASAAQRTVGTLDSVYIGCMPDGLTYDWVGNIGHVAIWNTVLSQAQVEALGAGANPLAVQAANLVAYWPFTEDGTTDVVGSYNLTLFGDAAYSSATDPTVDAPPSDASPLILPHRSSGGFLDLSGNFRG